MQEIYELVVETIQLRSPVLRLGNNLFPMALVRERLLQLTSEHIRFVLDGLRNLHTDVKNLKKYQHFSQLWINPHIYVESYG